MLRATRLKNDVMVRALLDHGADPGHTGKKGETALSISKKKKAETLVQLLSERMG